LAKELAVLMAKLYKKREISMDHRRAMDEKEMHQQRRLWWIRFVIS